MSKSDEQKRERKAKGSDSRAKEGTAARFIICAQKKAIGPRVLVEALLTLHIGGNFF